MSIFSGAVIPLLGSRKERYRENQPTPFHKMIFKLVKKTLWTNILSATATASLCRCTCPIPKLLVPSGHSGTGWGTERTWNAVEHRAWSPLASIVLRSAWKERLFRPSFSSSGLCFYFPNTVGSSWRWRSWAWEEVGKLPRIQRRYWSLSSV